MKLEELCGIRRSPSPKKLATIILGILGIVLLLCILILVGAETYPVLLIFAFVSFLFTVVFVWIISVIFGAISIWRSSKLDPNSLKKYYFENSLQTRHQASKMLSSKLQNDSLMAKVSAIYNKIGFTALKLWLAIQILAICTVLYLDHIGKWQEIINK